MFFQPLSKKNYTTRLLASFLLVLPKNTMIRLSIILSIGIILNISAQDFNNYQPLTCSGSLPKDFTDRTSDKVAKDIKENTVNTDSYKAQKSKNTFLLKSNYMLDELLMSGRVLFGDPVSEYVNKVADNLLKDEPKLRKKLRFYCLKSNVTNAFCTNQGMIFVTLGLIAQLENEAQLAQVLSHEIVHYTKKHVINTFLESSKISNGNGKYKYSSYDDNIIKLSNYSKSLEFEADSLGFFRLKNAGYSIQEALSVFDVLQFSYLPFDEVPFSYNYFETKNVKIPQEYKLDTIIPIKFEDDYDDSKSTHPNVKKRREQIIRLIKNETGGKTYIQSKELFEKIRTTSRFEGIRLSNKNADYVRAIYNAEILLKKYPNSDFLHKNILKALYGISKYKNADKYYEITEDFDEYEGEISAAYYFFEHLDKIQVNSITLEKLNQYYLKNKTNIDITNRIKDLINDLVEEEVNFNYFHKLIVKDTLTIISKKVDTVSKSNSKYAKLRAIKKQQEKNRFDVDSSSAKFHKEYLFSVSNANEIKEWFDEANSQKENQGIKVDPYEGMSYYQKRKAEKKANKKAKRNVYQNVKTDKVVFVDPDYFVIDERKGQKLENAEQKRYYFYKQIDMIANKAGVDYEILSPKIFNANDTEKYNDLAKLNSWVGEKMMHEDFKQDWNIISYESEYIRYLLDEYNTNMFLYTGVFEFKEKKTDAAQVLISTILAYPLLPYGIYYAVTPKYYTLYYNLFFDVKKDKLALDDHTVIKTKARKGNINSLMYNMLDQLK